MGAGKPGSKNDLHAIFRHPYFRGVDFSKLATKDSPLKDIPAKILKSAELEIQRSCTLAKREELNEIVRKGELKK